MARRGADVHGVVYGTITMNTIDQISAHKRGGPKVTMEVAAEGFGVSLGDFLDRCIMDELDQLQTQRAKINAK